MGSRSEIPAGIVVGIVVGPVAPVTLFVSVDDAGAAEITVGFRVGPAALGVSRPLPITVGLIRESFTSPNGTSALSLIVVGSNPSPARLVAVPGRLPITDGQSCLGFSPGSLPEK